MTKANTNDLKDKLQNKQEPAAGTQAKPVTFNQQITNYLKSMAPAMKAVLPKHMTPDRMMRIALSEIRKTPKLAECSIESLAGAVMQATKLGLEPGVLGHCYLIPFKNKGNMEVQFVIGYKGLIDLTRRSGQVLSIQAQAVHENDEFICEYGLNETLKHVPARGNRGEVTDYYAYAKFKDGGYTFLSMTKEDIEQHRDKHSKAKNFGPWVDHFDEMAKKTVIRAMVKYMPISVELQENVQTDETARDLTEIIDDSTIDMQMDQIEG
jgi:recombination protein RecT